MTDWIMLRYPDSGIYEVSDGHEAFKEFPTAQDAWLWLLIPTDHNQESNFQWGDTIRTGDENAPDMPDPTQWARASARRTNPPTSHAARTRLPGWNRALGRCIRILMEHEQQRASGWEEGLSAWEVERLGEARWGRHSTRHERFYNLYNLTCFNPPLVDPALRPDGTQWTHPGENDDPQNCWLLNRHGRAIFYEMEAKQI